MTKKQFVQFANFIASYGADCAPHDKESNKRVREDMARMVEAVATKDNPRFDRERFLKACGLN